MASDYDDFKFFASVVGGFLITVALLVFGLSSLMNYVCEKKWEGSGMPSKWQFFSGCRVQVSDGRWIPAENLRDIDLRPKEK